MSSDKASSSVMNSTNSNRQEMLRKKFCKDYNLPISITTSPYFEYYLDLYDDYLGCRRQWNTMLQIVDQQFRSSEGLFSLVVNDSVYRILNIIENSDIYVNYFNSSKVKPEEIWVTNYLKYYPNANVSANNLEPFFPNLTNVQQEVYTGNYDGFSFVSVDMTSANFNIMRFVDPELTLNCKTYKELIRFGLKSKLEDPNNNYQTMHKLDVDSLLKDVQNDDSPFFKYVTDAKYLRQVVFGKLSPKRQQVIQKCVMRSLIKLLLEKADQCDNPIVKKYLTTDRFGSCTADEIVIRVSDTKRDNIAEQLSKQDQLLHTNILMKFIRDTIDSEPYLQQVTFRVEGFTLQQIKSSKLGDKAVGYVKEYINDQMLGEKSHSEHRGLLNVEFKGVTNYLFPQVFKHYFGKEIQVNDRKFLLDGQFIATLDEPIF
ncbi:hypothetical protein C9374_010595 [Naegleria lovaniensis]|uniref:Uncharacterized protein n=1 Tax=Naegleria lovaniensis TaxID=51637 RepID=A0AA88GDL5_NAELO|nr:uncharacterized protein C9374_010595 [Naegleria lovaniensis]KAG2374576.1 hypothetical protein C9374_010595 [Naegleria lovaniensis]